MTITKAGGLALATMVLAVACGGSDSSPTSPTASGGYTGLEMHLSPAVLPAGETSLASVWAWTNGVGGLNFGPIPVTRWTSSNASVATVNTTGAITALAPGTTSITGAFEGGSHAATLAVFGQRDIEGLTVTCGPILPGSQGTFCDVVVRTRVGNGLVKATWTSSNPEVASLAGDGARPSSSALLLVKTAGQTIVTATYGAFQGTTTVEVR